MSDEINNSCDDEEVQSDCVTETIASDLGIVQFISYHHEQENDQLETSSKFGPKPKF